MLKLGIDIMGGDFAPRETVLGSLEAARELKGKATIVFLGNREEIFRFSSEKELLEAGVEVVHCTQVIEMSEHPTKAFQSKPDSSIAVGFKMLQQGTIHAFSSAGNTGAMLVGSMFTIKTLPGVLRPCIGTLVPKNNGGWGILLDVGVNADCKPEMLQQFALLGSIYARHILHIENPSVALLNIGEEEEKGNILSKEAHQLLKTTAGIRFTGNAEGRDLFNEKADVIVCDGFTGNIVLKAAEAFYDLIKKEKIKNNYFERFNYEDYGGTPILGVNGIAMIAHGISHAKAIKNLLLLSHECAYVRLHEKIKTTFSNTAETVS